MILYMYRYIFYTYLFISLYLNPSSNIDVIYVVPLSPVYVYKVGGSCTVKKPGKVEGFQQRTDLMTKYGSAVFLILSPLLPFISAVVRLIVSFDHRPSGARQGDHVDAYALPGYA